MQLQNGQGMEKHISEIPEKVDRLNGLGENLSNHLQVAFLLGAIILQLHLWKFNLMKI